MRLILPLPPTQNHSHLNVQKGKRLMRIRTEITRKYMNDAYWLAKDWANKTGWRVPDKQAKIIFRYWVWFQDHRRLDASNIVKVLADSLQGALYEDDKMLIVQNMDFAVDKTNPRVEVELEVVAREERAK